MYIIPKEITNKIGREIFMPRQKWQRELEEAIDSFSPGDALEAVRLDARLQQHFLDCGYEGCGPGNECSVATDLMQQRAKLGENTGSKP